MRSKKMITHDFTAML